MSAGDSGGKSGREEFDESKDVLITHVGVVPAEGDPGRREP